MVGTLSECFSTTNTGRSYIDAAAHLVGVGERVRKGVRIGVRKGVRRGAVEEVDVESRVVTRAGPFHGEHAA